MMGFFFFDMDDVYIFSVNMKVLFYVMEYIKGLLLLNYVSDKGVEWILVLMI